MEIEPRSSYTESLAFSPKEAVTVAHNFYKVASGTEDSLAQENERFVFVSCMY